ncbi:MAG: hypothetical protein A2X94_10745 [Bdellovibrionales bacterium GWB1_55_8]|nr:MAG: hypothetical protein A2X94_10745 [Bdellovibrionales bacterium GWB1_55_8]
MHVVAFFRAPGIVSRLQKPEFILVASFVILQAMCLPGCGEVTINLAGTPSPEPVTPPVSDPGSTDDTIPPSITTFSLPLTAGSLAVDGISIAASDNVDVTGYFLSEIAITPLASAVGWKGNVPTTFTFSGPGSRRVYAWAKDAAGNISEGKSTNVEISLNPSPRYYDTSIVPTLVAPTSSGTTYYVDGTNGLDTNDGLTPATAFKTITKATDRYSNRMKGGNTIKIKAGLYRERINLANITGNTDEAHRFTIGPFGDGEVIIDGSDTHTLTWSQHSGNPNIWRTPCDLKISGASKPPTAVVLDDDYKQGRVVYQLSDVSSYGRWWYDSVNKILYLHTNGDPPAVHDIIVVTEDRDSVQYAVKADLENFVTVYGLTVRGAGSFGVWMSADHCKAEYNLVKYNGKTGIFLKGNYGEILKNKTIGNVLLNWPRGKTWDTSGGWPNGGITTGGYGHVAGNIVDSNGGEGIGCMNGQGSIVVEDNIVSNSWSANIYLDSQPNDIIRRNLVFNNDYAPSNAIDASKIPAWTNMQKIQKRMIPNGVMMGDENASQGGTINYQIYNNLIINTYLGISHYMQRTNAGMINSIIANNTIIMPDSLLCPYGIYAGFELLNNNGLNVGSYFVNNVIISNQADQMLLHIGSGAEAGVTFLNNVYHAPNNPTPYWLGSYPYVKDNFGLYKAATGLDSNSSYADPSFAGGSNVFLPSFYNPAEGSPLLGHGTVQSGFSTDFNSNTRGPQWTVGAFE